MSQIQFLPWMRLGLAAAINQDPADVSSVSVIPQIDVLADGRVEATVPGPAIRLRGPGDVVALNPAEIKRRDPEPGATGAETSYFCSVEFFAPDLPWRYTPHAVNENGLLQPWLVLVVVELGPGVQLTKTGRLGVLSVDSPRDHLPDLADAWAWAHVQAAISPEEEVVRAYENDPSVFTSRLLCPRRLRADTRYTACIVPAFEAGRLAGLDRPSTSSITPAWNSDAVELPVYDSWELTAGDRYDFKTLARRIKPRELPEDVGMRDLDLSNAGDGLPAVISTVTFVGAMHAPNDGLTYWTRRKDQNRFEAAIRQRLNSVPNGQSPRTGFDPLVHDPAVSPTVYGAPQTGHSNVPETPPAPHRTRGWFEELNVGPHHRSVAGIGAEVVRADQESLMAAAWEQARAAIDVNRMLNRGRLAQEAASCARQKWNRLDDAACVSIAAPSLVSMRVAGSTAKRIVDEGDAPSTYFGAAFRRLGRPNGPLSTSATVGTARSPALAIIRAAIQSAASGTTRPPTSPLSTGFRSRYLPSGMDVGADLFAGGVGPGIGTKPPLLSGSRRRKPTRFMDRTARRSMRQRIAALPTIQLGKPVDSGILKPFEPPAAAVIDYGHGINQVSLDPFEFEVIRPIASGRIATTDADQGHLGIDLAATVRSAVQPSVAVLDAVQGNVSVPAQTWTSDLIPTHIGLQPRFTDPMYERVRALSVDYLVPGVGAVHNNTLGLLEINAAYVEAFLVGLNHEMSRELRWREYPAALGQTWFRHFWDNVEPSRPDIPPIAAWPKEAALGHIFGAPVPTGGGEPTPTLVVLIKADLIRKFPDVRVYAIPAVWDADERVPDDTADPLGPGFVGTLQRGVNFYGFPGLTEEAARGDDGNAGWFFVLEEESRAMRFGLDRGTVRDKGRNPKTTWANLTWANLAEKDEDVPWFCTIDTVDRIETAELDALPWGQDAAVMAGITFRRPIQVFMHASAMLPEPGGTDDER